MNTDFLNIQKQLSAFTCFETDNPEEWQAFILNKTSFTNYSFATLNKFSAFFNTTKLGKARINNIGNNSIYTHRLIHESDDIFCNLLIHGNFTTKNKNNEERYKRNDLAVSYKQGDVQDLYLDSPISLQAIFPVSILYNLIYSANENSKTKTLIEHKANYNCTYIGYTIQHIANSLDLFPHLASIPIIATQYEQLLYLSFLYSQPDILRYFFTKKSNSSKKIIKLVEEYIEANAERPLRLEDLVSLTGLSIRTIQEAFKKYRGYSPSHFLRERRLLTAHQILQQSPPDVSILSIALSCGFTTHAHFSECYKKRFGITPLESLKKVRT
ncbi:MAG: helix-turn-helix domain-containing protein [Solidesulfovibrio sp. DCME]|uniref:helix-turn-helix domain-containing protein n=1 Tax=Solidesulfovibrio sp. DCME TaxID=3447380 RepID=UPI003D0CD037